MDISFLGEVFQQDDSLGMNFRRGIPVLVTFCAMVEWERGTNCCCFRGDLSLLRYFLLVSRTSSWIPIPPTTLAMQDINQHLFGGEVLGAADFSGLWERELHFCQDKLIFFYFNPSLPGVPGDSLGNRVDVLEAGHDFHGIFQSYLQALGKIRCSPNDVNNPRC